MGVTGLAVAAAGIALAAQVPPGTQFPQPTQAERQRFINGPESAEKRRQTRAFYDGMRPRVQKALEGGDLHMAYALLINQTLFPTYDWLLPEQQREAASLFARVAAMQGYWDEANRATGLLIATQGVSRDDWRLRLHTARQANAAEDAFQAVQTLTKGSPDFIDDLDEEEILHLDELFVTISDGYEARFAWEDLLDKHGWQASPQSGRGDAMRFHYAVGLLERGRQAQARKVAALIQTPVAIAVMRADKRFDSIAPKGGFDPIAAAEAKLALARKDAEENPYSLRLQVSLASALHLLNRSPEALDLLDVAVGKAAISDRDKGVGYIDSRAWIEQALDWRAAMMVYTGQAPAGVNSMVELAARTGPAGAPENYVLGLGTVLVSLTRPQEAEPYLAGVKESTLGPRGRMQLASLRACAAAQVGNAAALEAQLAYLRAHLAARPEELLTALLCADRAEAAAELVKSLLADPGARASILMELQRFARKRVEPSNSRKINDGLEILRNRPDVQSALAHVGRIESYDLQNFESVS